MPEPSFDPSSPVFKAHEGGKLIVRSTMALTDRDALSLAYTPGVAEVSAAIAEQPELAEAYTWRSRLVAVVSDGTAVLGLGNIGPAAALPVMEGKCALFAEFAGLNSVPIVLDTTDPQQIIDTVLHIAPSFGGINLEDISAPRCFEIERQLRELLPIPVFHDDQHGTAIVVLADSRGVVHPSREDLNPIKQELAAITNRAGLTGSLAAAMVGADVFIGVSAGVVGEAAVAGMAADPIVFALANPTPEVEPVVAHRYASVFATGRSDLPNQINNVLAFPGIFAGAFDAGAPRITEGMKLAAAGAIGAVVGSELAPDYIVPTPFDDRVAPAVRLAVAEQARAEGIATR